MALGLPDPKATTGKWNRAMAGGDQAMASTMGLTMDSCINPWLDNQADEIGQTRKTWLSTMQKQPLRVSVQRRPWALVAAASCMLGVTIPGARAQNMQDDLINHYCTQAMNADFAKAGKTPPTGMVAYTCNCVIQQVNARATIAQAKAICQQQATAKFLTP